MVEKQLKHTYEKGGLLIEFPDPFLQRHLEDFQVGLGKQLEKNKDPKRSQTDSATVRTLISLEWLTGLTVHDVANSSPGLIRWVGSTTQMFMLQAQAIPKN